MCDVNFFTLHHTKNELSQKRRVRRKYCKIGCHTIFLPINASFFQLGSKLYKVENVKNALPSFLPSFPSDILSKMDSTVDPCEDFYSYACGTYEKATPIPSNLKSTHVLLQIQHSNRKFLKSLIENPKIRKHYSKVITNG